MFLISIKSLLNLIKVIKQLKFHLPIKQKYLDLNKNSAERFAFKLGTWNAPYRKTSQKVFLNTLNRADSRRR